MSDTNEWWEKHLTPRGWEEGSEKLDFGKPKKIPPPSDRVKTVRYHERGSVYSISRWLSVTWSTDDEEQLSRLEAEFGAVPEGYEGYPRS